jgi:hypothetical protein
MKTVPPNERLDRHALVTALWLALGFVAIILFDQGFGGGSTWALAGGFGVVLAAFIGHVIVNAVCETGFTPRELALGLVVFGAGLIAFVLAVLAVPGFGERFFAVMSLGFVVLFVVVVFYMVTHYGVRRVFDAFDVIRDFRSKDQAGGRL